MVALPLLLAAPVAMASKKETTHPPGACQFPEWGSERHECNPNGGAECYTHSNGETSAHGWSRMPGGSQGGYTYHPGAAQ